ncbi:BCCT family transporter, partial [Bacillus cereus]|nr:BCCT family transporter [Bacillus cereus]
QTGLDKGIKYLSNTNIIFAFALMIIFHIRGRHMCPSLKNLNP